MIVFLSGLFWLHKIMGISNRLLCNTVQRPVNNFVKKASVLGYCFGKRVLSKF
jgi:hypothetical protein